MAYFRMVVMLLCWQRAQNETGDNETTCDRPDNPYTVPSVLAQQPHGVRLDYIMYRANAGWFLTTHLDTSTQHQFELTIP